MKRSLFTVFTVLLVALTTLTTLAQGQTQEMPANFKKVLEAHGGLATWKAQQSLVFQKGEGEGAETHTVNLWNRHTRIDAPQHTIGFDGTEVWVSPADAEMRGSARFYHNLYFYFYAMPFVLADPGIYYEEVPAADLMGKSYPGVKISYGEGVGDSPDDNYILYYDADTYEMAWLMYTVTYRSGEPSDRYSLIKYGEWQSLPSGISLPKAITWYKYEEGKVGDVRSTAEFFKVALSEEAPAASKFARPEDARVADK